LKNALNSKGISKDFDEWIAIAKRLSALENRSCGHLGATLE
jgi:hypothetical protein